MARSTGAAPPPPAKSNKPIIITAIAVVVALVAGAGIYFFAIRDTNQVASTGAKSPQESVTALFTTLSNSDPIGLADQLDPVEATLFTDLNTDLITELKRLGVLSEAASADSMTGTTITVSGPDLRTAPTRRSTTTCGSSSSPAARSPSPATRTTSR